MTETRVVDRQREFAVRSGWATVGGFLCLLLSLVFVADIVPHGWQSRRTPESDLALRLAAEHRLHAGEAVLHMIGWGDKSQAIGPNCLSIATDVSVRSWKHGLPAVILQKRSDGLPAGDCPVEMRATVPEAFRSTTNEELVRAMIGEMETSR